MGVGVAGMGMNDVYSVPTDNTGKSPGCYDIPFAQKRRREAPVGGGNAMVPFDKRTISATHVQDNMAPLGKAMDQIARLLLPPTPTGLFIDV